MYAIVNNPQYKLPQLAPDGNYCPLELMLGDLNFDGGINIQDVILVVNLILDNEFNFYGDFNSDSTIDVLDVVQLVNLILREI